MNINELLLKKYGVATSRKVVLTDGRDQLITLFREAGFTSGAEIGTQRAAFANAICVGVPGVKLTCVDAWEQYGDYQPSFLRKNKGDSVYEDVKKALSLYNATIIRKYSMDAVKDIPDESLDFVYIDANHEFQSATNDIAEWSKKVKKGGIISGHDYIETDDPIHKDLTEEKLEAKEVVDGWTLAKGIKTFYVLAGDRWPSWFWVKE